MFLSPRRLCRALAMLSVLDAAWCYPTRPGSCEGPGALPQSPHGKSSGTVEDARVTLSVDGDISPASTTTLILNASVPFRGFLIVSNSSAAYFTGVLTRNAQLWKCGPATTGGGIAHMNKSLKTLVKATLMLPPPEGPDSTVMLKYYIVQNTHLWFGPGYLPLRVKPGPHGDQDSDFVTSSSDYSADSDTSSSDTEDSDEGSDGDSDDVPSPLRKPPLPPPAHKPPPPSPPPTKKHGISAGTAVGIVVALGFAALIGYVGAKQLWPMLKHRYPQLARGHSATTANGDVEFVPARYETLP